MAFPADLDRSYLIGPTPSRDIDARIDWQARVIPTGGSGIKMMTVAEDSVFVIDGHNMLSRLRREDGDRVWTLPVAGPVDEVFGLVYLPAQERVYVAVGDSMLVYESAVGSLVGRQHFERIANTAPVLFGSSMLYGARNGQLVWFSYSVGTQWRAYQVANTIRSTPVVSGNAVVVTGTNGMVMALNAASATQMWSKKLLDEIAAPVAVGQGAVFVAGVDQSLWAIDLASGRGLWRYRTESPLRTAPTVVQDRVYQFVPGQGLVCLEAVPLDSPGGVVIWKSPDATGKVLTMRRDSIYVWDSNTHVLSVVSAAKGHIIKQVTLPSVRHLTATKIENGELFAAGDDGRVIHLAWRN